MVLITSDCVAMRFLSTKWSSSPHDYLPCQNNFCTVIFIIELVMKLAVFGFFTSVPPGHSN